ncbi:E3 ubiquitin-protein ligase [Schistosoma japonicum]|nr:E3 ubiquitin-protein ligase [Schistosoma japonicum]KAH8850793.1 E3 ubiquitin-protein ligase [Schistosoma japonicum]
MRVKNLPVYLSSSNRHLKSFYYHPKLTIKIIGRKNKSAKRKALSDEQREILQSYPNVISLLPGSSVSDHLVQTITLPINGLLSTVVNQCQKITLFFNNNSLLFLIHESDVKEYIVPDASSVVPLLYAASSYILQCLYRVDVNSISLDVYLKDYFISENFDFSSKPIPVQQYEKLHDFLTLLHMEDFHLSPSLKSFVYERRCETQFQFVTMLKKLFDIAQDYHIQTRSVWDSSTFSPQHKCLLTRLRSYQCDAVKWMVYQECNGVSLGDNELLEKMFLPVKLSSHSGKFYFCVYSGLFTKHLPVIEYPRTGGILADEMGLGKTLEVISLILTHPLNDWEKIGGQLRTLEDKPLPTKHSSVTKNGSDIFYEQHRNTHILCTCGGVEETEALDVVHCSLCNGPGQHATCVQYNPSLYTSRLPVKEGYVCPHCWTKIRIYSKATLIISPDHIWQQWKEELQTHVIPDVLQVLIYAGMEAPVTSVEFGIRESVKEQGNINPFSPRTHVPTKVVSENKFSKEMILPGFVQPPQLACADIVLTSYSVVQRELDWVEVVANRQAGVAGRPKLRLAQRYICRPSPLTCVRWWRVCLDEAQMVERVTSRTARMLSQVSAVNRWCVTGTPAEKSIDDLFGLFAYLRLVPYSHSHYWNSLLYQPFLATCTASPGKNKSNSENEVEPVVLEKTLIANTDLSKILSKLLWRNTKVLVSDQLAIPPITEQIHWITFTPVERYIHDRVLAQSASALERLVQNLSISPDQSLCSLPTAAHWRLVYLITRLRQACTHPSLVVATGGSHKNNRDERSQIERANGLATSEMIPNMVRVGLNDNEHYYDNGEDYSKRTNHAPTVADARAHRNLGTGCFTMTEVIRRVVDETRRECEGLLRSWVFNKNGAAGCFIIKGQLVQAADCYRDVLRSADSFERHHGILADWSQRLHAITNLHWLIQTQKVPILDEPLPKLPLNPPLLKNNSYSVVSVHTGKSADFSLEGLDPRVDRDLFAKAERLRTTYIQMHSQLLAKVRENLDPIVEELDNELCDSTKQGSNENLTDRMASIDAGGWLSWLTEAIDFLISSGLGHSLIDMLVASFQSRPNMNRSGFRTSLLYAGSAITFKAMLLTELGEVFATREQLRTAMQPMDDTWNSFVTGREVDRRVLQPFYGCCARAFDTDEESKRREEKKKTKSKTDDKTKKLNSENNPSRRITKKTRCAYCIALRALCNYQRALNHERTKTIPNRPSIFEFDVDNNSETFEKSSIATASVEESGTGLILNNPLVMSLSIVCQQLSRLLASTPANELPFSKALYQTKAKRLEQLIRLMGKEIMLTSRTQSLTREWWNIHDDTEQFVIRLQATCPTDLAFIHEDEVDGQLHSYIVEADMIWPRLQSRLGHFNFLRNAHLTAVTGFSTSAEDANGEHSKSRPLECPTCLQLHSPCNPTFVLLPGCWHTLCVACHDRIASLNQVSQQRCPICRTPFQSTETAGINARRRRPLTLIHYAGNKAYQEDSIKPDETEEQLNIAGDHSTKVRSVIQRLKVIKQEDPDAKAIVFSSWLSVLVTLAGALDQNGLAYTTLFHARDACCPGRLAGFQCFGSTVWILLMPVQLGANGLNLTSANHVLFIDPVLSHAREAQAVARIHRIGQTRPGIIHRFLVKDSIEAALHASQSRNTDLSPYNLDTECMIGAGIRRTSSTSLGVAGPSEDRAQLMRMTIKQLTELLHYECNTGMLTDEMKSPSFSLI